MELKFRAWDPDYQEMYYSDKNGETEEVMWGFGLNGKITVSTLEVIDRMEGGNHEQRLGYIEHDNVVLMQYTGLKDGTKWEQLTEGEQSAWLSSGKTKEQWNGKEIYEGDIVEFDKYQWYSSPVLTKEDIDEKPPYREVVETIFDYEFLGARSNDWPYYGEVIGNIYDNPELLSERKGENG